MYGDNEPHPRLPISPNVDEWTGWMVRFLESRIKDAPDERCKALAQNLWELAVVEIAAESEERTSAREEGLAE